MKFQIKYIVLGLIILAKSQVFGMEQEERNSKKQKTENSEEKEIKAKVEDSIDFQQLPTLPQDMISEILSLTLNPSDCLEFVQEHMRQLLINKEFGNISKNIFTKKLLKNSDAFMTFCLNNIKNHKYVDGSIWMINILLENGFNENLDEYFLEFCKHITDIECDRNEGTINDIVINFIKNGANPNFENQNYPYNALDYSCENRSYAIMETLMRYGNVCILSDAKENHGSISLAYMSLIKNNKPPKKHDFVHQAIQFLEHKFLKAIKENNKLKKELEGYKK